MNKQIENRIATDNTSSLINWFNAIKRGMEKPNSWDTPSFIKMQNEVASAIEAELATRGI